MFFELTSNSACQSPCFASQCISIDKHVPLTKAFRKKRKLISKPWITERILVSIKKKQKLCAKFYKIGTEAQKLFYEIYAYKLTKIKRLSKKLYLQQKIINSKRDMLKFWGIIKTLLSNNYNSSQPFSVSFNENMLTDPKDIANCFNNHFCSIGKSLVDKIDPSYPLSYRKYLQNRTKASMHFRPNTLAAEIFNVIFQGNPNKSCGFDGINAGFVKIAADVISPILAVLINACFDVGIFPSCLKIAKVVPIFETADKCQVNNFRPISLSQLFMQSCILLCLVLIILLKIGILG